MAEEPTLDEQQETQPTRERFDEELVRRWFAFGNEVLQDIPELEVLTLVPVWGIPQDKMIPAIYLTKEGAGMSPHQLMLTLDRFLAGTDYKVNRIKELLEATGEMLNKQAEEIDANQKLIEEQEKLLNSTSTGEPYAQSEEE